MTDSERDSPSPFWGRPDNVRLLSAGQGIWINSMQSIHQNKCNQTCCNSITSLVFYTSYKRKVSHNDKMSCSSWCSQGGMSVSDSRAAAGVGGAVGIFLYFQPRNAAITINSPSAKLFFLLSLLHKLAATCRRWGLCEENHCYLSPLLAVWQSCFTLRSVHAPNPQRDTHLTQKKRSETGLLFTGDSLINTLAGG